MKLFCSIVSFFTVMLCFAQESSLVTVHRAMELMGSRFDITVVASNEDIGYINIDEAKAEIQRIESLISAWDPNSETSLINRNAGVAPVAISLELFNLIERCIEISELTDGAFDITYSSLDAIYKFDGTMLAMPLPEQVQKSILKVGYENIVLDKVKQTVFLKKEGVKISFGAIGKGYAADKAKELLVSKQVVGGIINAAGDLTTWGTKADGQKWLIGIANPLSSERIFSWLPVVESSVATSGNYEKHFILDGIKYSHIIDSNRVSFPRY